MFAHIFQGEEAVCLDCRDDRPFGDAVTAADLGVVGHGCGAVFTAVTCISEVVGAEHQLVANFGDVLLVFDELEVPSAIDGVTIENGAEADRVFSMLMGDEVPPRREFIEKNAVYAKLDV